MFAANFPLTEDDLERQQLPKSLQGREPLCFGLIIDAERLMQIRNERRPGSRYASLAQCSYELRQRSEEHTSELQSLMRISYAVFCLKKKKKEHNQRKKCSRTS